MYMMNLGILFYLLQGSKFPKLMLVSDYGVFPHKIWSDFLVLFLQVFKIYSNSDRYQYS